MDRLAALFGDPNSLQLSSVAAPKDPFADAVAMFAQRQQDQSAQPPDQLAQLIAAPPPIPTPPPPEDSITQAAKAASGFGSFVGGPPPVIGMPVLPQAVPAPLGTARPLGLKPTKQEIATGVREGGQLQEQAVQNEAEAVAAQKDYISQQTLQALQDQQTQADTLTQAREAIQQRYQQRLGKVNEEVERLGQQKPDPAGYFKDRGTLANILTFIGVALGGYQSAKTGRNPALELLQREIDRHVEAQARGFQQQMATLQERKGAAKEEAASNLDTLEYKTAQAVATNNRVIQMIGAAASKYDTPQILARAQQAIGQLRQNNAMKMEELRAKSVQEGLQGAQLNLQQQEFKVNQEHWQKNYELEVAKALQSGDIARAGQLQKMSAQSIFAVIDPETKAPIVAPSDKVAEDVNAKIGAADDAYNKIAQVLELNEKGYAVPWAERRQRADSLTIDLQNSLSKLSDQGVITASDAERYGKLLGDPARMISNDPRLRQAQGEIVDKINYAVKARTGRPGIWKANADPEYATSIRPPGFKPRGTLDLQAVPQASGEARRGGRTMTKEEYRAQQLKDLEDFRRLNAEPLAPIPALPFTGVPRLPGQTSDEDLLHLAGLMGGR